MNLRRPLLGLLGASKTEPPASAVENQAATVTESSKLEGDSDQLFAYFGCDTAVSNNYLVVGALREANNIGAAYIFQKSGNSWNRVQKVDATAEDDTRAPSDEFGVAVDIDGSYILVGCHQCTGEGGAQSGTVYAYKLSGGTWVFDDEGIIMPLDSTQEGYFVRTANLLKRPPVPH